MGRACPLCDRQGVIDLTTGAVESLKEVAATLRDAMEFVDAERIGPCPNCGMAPPPRDVAAGKLRTLDAGPGGRDNTGNQ